MNNSPVEIFKQWYGQEFIITGTLTSRKGIEISEKVSLTFWWTETERQVRVQGNAGKITKVFKFLCQIKK